MNDLTLKKIYRILLIVTALFVLFIRFTISSLYIPYSELNLFSTLTYIIYLSLILFCFIVALIIKLRSIEKHPVFFFLSLAVLVLGYPSLLSYWSPTYYFPATGINMEFLMSFGTFGTDFYTDSFFFLLLYYAMNLSVLLGVAALIFLKTKGHGSTAKGSKAQKQPKKSPVFTLQKTGKKTSAKSSSASGTYETSKIPVTYSEKTDTTTQIDIFDKNDHFFTRHTRDDIF